MSLLKSFFASTAGRLAGGILLSVFIGVGVWLTLGNMRTEVPDAAYYTTFICSETGKSFEHKNADGDMEPILSPYSGKNTGYRAELCFWNADGTAKEKATAVLLNESVGVHEPTFCPECGRLVRGHNPRPREGMKAPPTEAEYRANGGR